MGSAVSRRDYAEVANIIRWYIKNAYGVEVKQVRMNGGKYPEEKLTKEGSVNRYTEEILEL